MRTLTPPTGTFTQKPQEARHGLRGTAKGLIWGAVAGAAMVASLYVYDTSYEANLYEDRRAEALEMIDTLYEGGTYGLDADFQSEMSGSVRGKLRDAEEDGYITLAEMGEIETDVRKWKALKKAYGYGE